MAGLLQHSIPCSSAAAAASSTCRSTLPLCRVHSTRQQVLRQTPVVCSAAAVATDREVASLGPDKWNNTYYPTMQDAAAVHKKWVIVNAEGQTLGRLAVLVAMAIRGKDQPTYTPSMDMGQYVIVINAEKVQVTGNKFNDKLYRSHPTARPGTLKTETFKQLQQRIPERIVEKAVKGMLPKNRIGRHLFTHLKVFKGDQHPHAAQKPTDITHRINQKPMPQ